MKYCVFFDRFVPYTAHPQGVPSEQTFALGVVSETPLVDVWKKNTIFILICSFFTSKNIEIILYYRPLNLNSLQEELLPFVTQICWDTRRQSLPWDKISLILTLFTQFEDRKILDWLQNFSLDPWSISLGDFSKSTGCAESYSTDFIRDWEKNWEKQSLWKAE